MSHSHYVDSGHASADIVVHALQIVQNGFFPVAPVALQQQLPISRRFPIGKRPVKCPDCPVHVSAQTLVGRVHIAERGRVHENVVPGEISAVGVWKAIQSEIRCHPWRVFEVAQWSYAFDQVGCKESWRGKNYELGLIPHSTGQDVEASFGMRNSMHHLPCAHKFSHAFKQSADDPAVSFRPRKRTFFFGLARGEVLNAGPS